MYISVAQNIESMGQMCDEMSTSSPSPLALDSKHLVEIIKIENKIHFTVLHQNKTLRPKTQQCNGIKIDFGVGRRVSYTKSPACVAPRLVTNSPGIDYNGGLDCDAATNSGAPAAPRVAKRSPITI